MKNNLITTVLFYCFLTVFSTFYLMEVYGPAVLQWREQSSFLMAFTTAMVPMGFAWGTSLNTLSIFLFFLSGGLLVSCAVSAITTTVIMAINRKRQHRM